MPAAPSDTPAPEQVLVTTMTAIADVVAVRGDELAADRRKLRALIDELVRPRFDLETTCRLILGQHWKTATPEQRQRFVETFYEFLVASYGDALLDFRHGALTVHPAKEPLIGSSTQVRTSLALGKGKVFHIAFYLRLDDRGWRVVDALIEGVSYVRTYRSDFGAEIRANGLDALNDRLEALIANKATLK